jgi:NAD+ synthetase
MTPQVKKPASPLRVGLAQFKPLKADVSGNLEAIRSRWIPASREADILVFPETALTGYFLEGGVVDVALPVEEVAEGLGEAGFESPTVILGFYERWRRGIFNSVACFEPREGVYRPVHVHRKLFQPTYGVFEEARFADPGRELEAFNTRFGRVGMLVCEEMWHSLPATILALDGAELIVVVSASPARDFPPGLGRSENLARWDTLAQGAAMEHGVFVAVSQLVGSEGGKVFLGGSIVVSPGGSILARGPLLEEETVYAALDGQSIERARFQTPLLADLRQMLPHLQRSLEAAGVGVGAGDALHPDETTEAVHSKGEGHLAGPGPYLPTGESPRPGEPVPALDLPLVRRILVEFIREEVVNRRGFQGVVLGVSGGVDSAVSLYLAVEALGPENVLGFRLPYATSSPESLEHADLVLAETGAQRKTIDITPTVDAYIEEVDPELDDLRRGNLAARVRAVTLFDQSARLGRLPLGTGNKSERLLGYFTWHADDSPPINPLGDLFKTQVWELARHLGVPEAIVEKPASADLIRGIHDEDELGVSYPEADPILNWLLSGYGPGELVGLGFRKEAVDAVWGRFNGTHWKRELPTVAVLSGTAIGEFFLRPVDY